MKVVVVGTGGVGGYFGGMLAAAGNDVTFIARGSHLEAIKQNGLLVKSINGDVHIRTAKVTDCIASAGIADVVLVCVKAWQVNEVAPQIKSIADDKTVVIPLENGVLSVEELAEVVGEKNVVGGLCRIFSKMESPGVINHFDAIPTIIFGERNNETSERVLSIKAMFESAKVNAIVPKDIAVEVWKKFLFICSSGLLAVTRSSYGEVRELPETRSMLKNLFEEIYQVARAQGVMLDESIVEKTLKSIDTFAYDATSSLTRDVMEGKPSEVEFQNGTIVRLGKKWGVKTPVNEFIYSVILPMEKRARGKR